MLQALNMNLWTSLLSIFPLSSVTATGIFFFVDKLVRWQTLLKKIKDIHKCGINLKYICSDFTWTLGFDFRSLEANFNYKRSLVLTFIFYFTLVFLKNSGNTYFWVIIMLPVPTKNVPSYKLTKIYDVRYYIYLLRKRFVLLKKSGWTLARHHKFWSYITFKTVDFYLSNFTINWFLYNFVL